MRRARPLPTLLAMLLAAALAAAGCSSPAAQPAAGASSRSLKTVTLVLDWTPNTNHSGIYLARANGWYRQAGLNVKIIEPGASGSLQPLAAGRADFAVSVAEDVLPARAQGLPVVSLGAVLGHNTSSLLSLAASGIRRPRDLQGKTYGGYGGQLERALVSSLVRCDGGDPRKVKFVSVGDADYRVGLTRHFYDFVWIFDGWDKIRMATIDRLPVTTIPFAAHTGCIPDWYTPLIATNTALVGQDPRTVRAFMAATARGYREAMAHPDRAAAALLHAAPELDHRLVGLSASYLATRYAATAAAWGHQDRLTWQRFADFLHRAGLIKTVDVGAAYTNDFLPAGGKVG